LSVVLPESARRRFVAGIRSVGAVRPLPDVSEHAFQGGYALARFRAAPVPARCCPPRSISAAVGAPCAHLPSDLRPLHRARSLPERSRVEAAGFDEISFDSAHRRRRLPFLLARQARPRPARERIGFVVAAVTDRLVPSQWPRAGEGDARSI